MQTIKGLLFDIGGVLYVGDTMISGANDTIAILQKKYPMRFLTNTTRRTPIVMMEKLNRMGFSVKIDELFTALDATKSYVHSQNGTVHTLLTDEADVWFSELKSDVPDFVVVGDAHLNFSYERMNEAFRYLLNGAKLIAAAKNKYFKEEDGLLAMDAGGFITALEFASGVEAKIIGKPSKAFFHLAVASMGLKPEEVLMIGDDIISDIQGAKDAGLHTALVKTGKFQDADLHLGIDAEYILDDVTHLLDMLDEF
ncbi:MAG TPA: TIGR01458 family HAD-type hydrolase [Epsilonproteobacteria bacterium]|nr:TIGR01458 family HAD-type hydrolase [Campylobacterota bacterium]